MDKFIICVRGTLYLSAHCFIIEPGNESCPAAEFFNCVITSKISDSYMRGRIKR